MSDVVLEFVSAMKAAGIGPSDQSEIIANDTINRYHVDGDRRGVKNGVYCLADDGDGFGYGWFMSHRLGGEVIKWHSKSKRKWSEEEREEHKRKVAEAKAKREADRERELSAARDEATKIWNAASRSGESSYLDRKGIVGIKGVRYEPGALVVPMYRGGELVSVQRILDDGSKLFIKGSDHIGAYFSLRGDMDTFAICEGVATAWAVHRATGWSVIAAFNAGNLKPVAKAIRVKYPDTRIVIAADNDHESKNAKGEPWNAGVEKANQAAVAIGGAQVIVPQCEMGESDWDDVARRIGFDAVGDLLRSVPASIDMDDISDDWQPDYEASADELVENDPWSDIRPLGHNRGEYFFFPLSTGQIMTFTATALGRSQNLYQLAPRRYWERLYAPEEKMSVIAEMASAGLIEACHDRGIFSVGDARGVGVWRDKGGKLLVNCGDVIVGEDVRCHPSAYGGDYVYEAGARVIDLDVDQLSNTEASRFRDICKSLTWRHKYYGDLLAGWCVIAAVGGSIDWRPHIFITGQKGSGKSTAMEKIVLGALDGIAVKRDGGTTEAGIRKALGASSRPFIMDEAEAESGPRRAQMQAIFEYFRNASSGSVVENAYHTYVARSAACFGAINPRIEQGADADRWSILELIPNTTSDRDDHYKKLLDDIREVIRRDFPDRLLTRTVAHLDVLLDNIGIFVDVFSRKLGSKRAGDQIGTLVAGSHSLVSNKRVTVAFVEDWVGRQDWQWDELTGGGSDADALVGYIMSARIRYDSDGMVRESRVGDLVAIAAGYNGDVTESAVKGLAGFGIKVDGDRLIISNTSPGIKEVLKDTAWGIYRRTLGDFEGADNYGGAVVYFAPGVNIDTAGLGTRG